MEKFGTVERAIIPGKRASSLMYKATVMCHSSEDDYEKGEGALGASWNETFLKKSLRALLEEVANYVHALSIRSLENDGSGLDYNELSWGYMMNERNDEATPREIALWKKGELRLWSVTAHILVSQIGQSKVSDADLKNVGLY